jgi:hypothetical protein
MMKTMSLHQFIRQQAREPQDPVPQEILTMRVGDLIDAVETNFEDDCTAEVILDSPEPDRISVKFSPQIDKADQPGKQSPTFEVSFVRIGDGLPDLRDYATVEVTLDKHDPTKVQLRFRKDEESGD